MIAIKIEIINVHQYEDGLHDRHLSYTHHPTTKPTIRKKEIPIIPAIHNWLVVISFPELSIRGALNNAQQFIIRPIIIIIIYSMMGHLNNSLPGWQVGGVLQYDGFFVP